LQTNVARCCVLLSSFQLAIIITISTLSPFTSCTTPPNLNSNQQPVPISNNLTFTSAHNQITHSFPPLLTHGTTITNHGCQSKPPNPYFHLQFKPQVTITIPSQPSSLCREIPTMAAAPPSNHPSFTTKINNHGTTTSVQFPQQGCHQFKIISPIHGSTSINHRFHKLTEITLSTRARARLEATLCVPRPQRRRRRLHSHKPTALLFDAAMIPPAAAGFIQQLCRRRFASAMAVQPVLIARYSHHTYRRLPPTEVRRGTKKKMNEGERNEGRTVKEKKRIKKKEGWKEKEE
jgi:hypothetical protein